VSRIELFLRGLVSDLLLFGFLLLFILLFKIIKGSEVVSSGCEGKTTSEITAGRLNGSFL
jgi:hypothetical protein